MIFFQVLKTLHQVRNSTRTVPLLSPRICSYYSLCLKYYSPTNPSLHLVRSYSTFSNFQSHLKYLFFQEAFQCLSTLLYQVLKHGWPLGFISAGFHILLLGQHFVLWNSRPKALDLILWLRQNWLERFSLQGGREPGFERGDLKNHSTDPVDGLELKKNARVAIHSGSCCCCCWIASVVSDFVRPHRRQPTRLPCPWDSPGKNTGVGCHFFLQCVKVKSESEVAQWCPTLRDPTDCSPPGSSIHEIFQARVLEWGALAFSAGSC